MADYEDENDVQDEEGFYVHKCRRCGKVFRTKFKHKVYCSPYHAYKSSYERQREAAICTYTSQWKQNERRRQEKTKQQSIQRDKERKEMMQWAYVLGIDFGQCYGIIRHYYDRHDFAGLSKWAINKRGTSNGQK